MDNLEVDNRTDLEVLQDSLEEAQDKLRLYRSLLKHRGWGELSEVFGQMVTQKNVAVQAPLGVSLLVASQNDAPRDGFAQVMISEYEKGVRDGMIAVLNLPQNTVEYAEAEIPALRERIVELSPAEEGEE